MKKSILKTAVIISGVLFFTACSKDDSIKNILKEETAGQAAQKGKPISQLTRIKTRTLGLDIRTFTYDASGRATGYTGSSFLTYDYPDASHVIETPQWSPSNKLRFKQQRTSCKSNKWKQQSHIYL
jgi:hypothetical protein